MFRDMFRQNTTKNTEPAIFLKGVSSIDLSNLLAFMYNGEVNVSKANLSSFLSVAEELQVKGLQLNNKSTVKKPDPLPIAKDKERRERDEKHRSKSNDIDKHKS